MTLRIVAAAFLALIVARGAVAAEESPKVDVVPVSGNVSMLVGTGGNIGVSVGSDGILLIDDQYAPATEEIRMAVATLHEGLIRFVLNTHWHQDHTGGNENLGKGGAVIVAHENVRKRMSTGQFLEALDRKVEPAPGAALPIVTFTGSVTFHLNGDEIRVMHVDPAHTDGDAIVHFTKADVLHLGDTFFNGRYPFIDESSGGSVDGVIDAIDRGLRIAGEDTKIIPGHGPLATKNDLRAYRGMLFEVRSRIREALKQKKTVEEIVAARPTADFDDRFGNGFLSPDRFVRILCSLLKP